MNTQQIKDFLYLTLTEEQKRILNKFAKDENRNYFINDDYLSLLTPKIQIFEAKMPIPQGLKYLRKHPKGYVLLNHGEFLAEFHKCEI